MPADIGEMFYTGEVPWHGQGIGLQKSATMEEALKVGGLNWQVGTVDLMTAEEPASWVPKRKAIVRLDRPCGQDGRVLGVAHRGVRPLQNRDGAILFDAIFGQGRPVYHTGGYLGNGEVVWLLGAVDHPLDVAPGDVVQPFALFANSHDGSIAVNIRLTTVRVVCRNTLSLALQNKKFGREFRRAHQGTFREHAEAAREFFATFLEEFDFVGQSFARLTKSPCDGAAFREFLGLLLPDPPRPRNADRNPGILSAWEKRLHETRRARQEITRLRETGRGVGLRGVRGTFWGALNAVLEFVDHFSVDEDARLAHALLGDGMDLKTRAFDLVRELAAA